MIEIPPFSHFNGKVDCSQHPSIFQGLKVLVSRTHMQQKTRQEFLANLQLENRLAIPNVVSFLLSSVSISLRDSSSISVPLNCAMCRNTSSHSVMRPLAASHRGDSGNHLQVIKLMSLINFIWEHVSEGSSFNFQPFSSTSGSHLWRF